MVAEMEADTTATVLMAETEVIIPMAPAVQKLKGTPAASTRTMCAKATAEAELQLTGTTFQFTGPQLQEKRARILTGHARWKPTIGVWQEIPAEAMPELQKIAASAAKEREAQAQTQMTTTALPMKGAQAMWVKEQEVAAQTIIAAGAKKPVILGLAKEWT